MKQNIIKYWGKKIFFTLTIANLIIMIIYIILGSVLIKTTEAKLINILLTLLVNFIFLGILYAFSISNSIYETVYQIKTDNKGYEPKLYRYLLILFGFLWLTFFGLAACYMFAEAIAYHTSLDYFQTLKNDWWKILIISCYHVALITIHRQIMWYTINYQKLPWEKEEK
ncbi:hypothetical protein [Spiroplasma platyhelix]|uniref:Transmembrane protein n=1 Tax=Spiroplasma platyhelix PALS-1 TaxID=1276218 RepID=A0A846U5F4_9MOLU|nr:hypothetical protein [Spiroplasma platyhelix]MBE4704315.1 hypothetical protein [Spiroplasma platyhelix PALS-1]NKE38687.1 hypothetical protein [Spiroplasma platyhelix PALS-1]UJB28899.1 hypothetical protein SPLAT_v1c01320 [Spiroplasma platyhelix PALS-1]